MRPRVIVSGHTNPDTDSICAALGYAFYKNRTDTAHAHIAVRGGEVNDETRYVLERFGFRIPPLVRTLAPQVQDIPRKRLVTVTPATHVGTAAMLMKKHGIHSLPVLDTSARVCGIIDATDIATAYAEQLEHTDTLPCTLEVATLTQQLSGRVLAGHDGRTGVGGRIIIVAGAATCLPEDGAGASVVIIDGVPAHHLLDSVLSEAAIIVIGRPADMPCVPASLSRFAVVMATELSVTRVLRTLWSSIPVAALMDEHVSTIGLTDTLDRAKKIVLETSSRCAVVLDAHRRPVSIVTRSDLIRFARKKVILVDHNETAQAIDGVEQADILEIVDHHRVGDISTFRPIYFYNEPVGSTCTMVAELCIENGVTVPVPLAGLLLSGILSDTMNLTLSTTTAKDVRLVQRLSEIAGIDSASYGLEILRNGSVMFKDLPAHEVFMKDFKEFVLFDTRIGVSQAVVFSFDGVREREPEIMTAMRDIRSRMGLATVAFMATDPVGKASYLLVVGETAAVEEAFDVRVTDGHVILSGVLSRKKDFIPPLAEVLSRSL